MDIIVNNIQLERAFAQEKPFLVPSYNVLESETSTKTLTINNRTYEIHIVLWNEKEKAFYDDNTLSYAILHELTHVIVPDKNHGDQEFEIIEKTLLNTAIKLGYYDKKMPISPSYPCVEID